MLSSNKIAFFTGLGQGGAAKQVVETAHLLADKGHCVQIMTYDRSKAFYQVRDDIEIIDLQGHSGIMPESIDKIVAVARLSRAIRKTAPDVVISYTTMMNIFLGFAGLSLLRNRSALLIGSDRNSVLRYNQSRIWVWICRFFYQGLDGVFSNSQLTVRNLSTVLKIPEAKTGFLANLLDTDYFCPLEDRQPVQDKTWRILVPARVTAQKNQKILVPVAEYLIGKGRAFKFVLAGLLTQPYSAELKEMIQEKNLSHCFGLLGQQKDIRNWYRSSDLVFMPSLFEGLSNSLIEAMACQSVVLCSDIPDFSAYIRDTENGFLVEIDQPERIGDKIIAIMEAELTTLDHVRAQARNSVLQFGPQTYYQNMMLMIDQFRQYKTLSKDIRSGRKSE